MVGLGDLKGIFQPKRFWLSILGSTVIENNQVIVAFLGYRKPGLESFMLHFHTKNGMHISYFSGQCTSCPV